MTELRHGYTLRDIQRLAGHATKTAFGQSTSRTDRFQAAWDGIVEALYEAERWPSGDKLISAGRQAIALSSQAEQHHHGVRHDRTHEGAGSMPNFQRYWCLMTKPYPSPEAHAVERVSVPQILARLYPCERKALAALAAHGTQEAAAHALGMKLASYRATLGHARRRFFALWHEGEEPSRIWRIDRRVNGYGELSNRTSAAQLRSHRRSYARSRARAADRTSVVRDGP